MHIVSVFLFVFGHYTYPIRTGSHLMHLTIQYSTYYPTDVYLRPIRPTLNSQYRSLIHPSREPPLGSESVDLDPPPPPFPNAEDLLPSHLHDRPSFFRFSRLTQHFLLSSLSSCVVRPTPRLPVAVDPPRPPSLVLSSPSPPSSSPSCSYGQ